MTETWSCILPAAQFRLCRVRDVRRRWRLLVEISSFSASCPGSSICRESRGTSPVPPVTPGPEDPTLPVLQMVQEQGQVLWSTCSFHQHPWAMPAAFSGGYGKHRRGAFAWLSQEKIDSMGSMGKEEHQGRGCCGTAAGLSWHWHTRYPSLPAPVGHGSPLRQDGGCQGLTSTGEETAVSLG